MLGNANGPEQALTLVLIPRDRYRKEPQPLVGAEVLLPTIAEPAIVFGEGIELC